MFQGEIEGQHADKNWLEQSRECVRTAVEQDSIDMEQFGGDTVYIQTLKKILEMYDPNVAYNTSKGCSNTDKKYRVCANRRAFILFFHDGIKIDPRDPRTPKKIRVRNVPLLPRILTKSLGRATKIGNAFLDPQFRNWLSKDEYEKRARDILEKSTKPDFFSPVPPYPRVEIEGWDAPLGYTKWTLNNVPLEKDPDMQYTERAHLVESAAQKWLQYLVNYESIDNPNFLTITDEKDVIDVKSKLAALHTANEAILYNGEDKDPDYHIPNNFENMQQSDLYGIELYTLDSAANIVVINHRAHSMLLDNWLVDHGGTPNMSSGAPHDFFTIDTTGQVHGIVKLSTPDGREWISTRKRDGRQFRTGIGPNSRINPYWYDVSDKMFKRDRVQWLQNYRRKRWTQIRNIISAFMVEANANPSIDQNDKQNVCDPSKGCKYSRSQASQPHWTSQYDEEWAEYQNYLSEHGLAKQLEDLTMTGETKDDSPPYRRPSVGGLAKQLEDLTMTGETKDDSPPYRRPSVGDRISIIEKIADGSSKWSDGQIVTTSKFHSLWITIRWDDRTRPDSKFHKEVFAQKQYGDGWKYLSESESDSESDEGWSSNSDFQYGSEDEQSSDNYDSLSRSELQGLAKNGKLKTYNVTGKSTSAAIKTALRQRDAAGTEDEQPAATNEPDEEESEDEPPAATKELEESDETPYRPPSVGDRISKMEKMDDGTTRWFDATIVKKTKTNKITIKWDDVAYKNERYALKEFQRLYGTVLKYLDSSTTTTNGPSSKKHITSKQKKRTASSTTAVISADYDGCFDVLFPDIEANYRSDYPDDDIEKDRQELLAHILKIEKKYDNIILLVGSTRQTPGIDKKIRNMMNINRTIRFDTKTDDNLCFVNFATLAKERGWEFRDDVQFPDETKADKSKVSLIKAQLSFVYTHHDYDFYFFDNDKRIIEKTRKAYQNNGNSSGNIYIIRFEWQ